MTLLAPYSFRSASRTQRRDASIDMSGGGRAMQDRPVSSNDAQAALSQSIIHRLRRGELAQMVDWFDPGLLAKVAVRSIISATLGQYTDQRLMQAATDNASWDELAARYDYSGTGKPGEAIEPGRDGAVWVDYIADLGDGFEATYAMAYLLSAETLTVHGEPRPLPAGKLLIMGGDQVYPDATKQEYQSRLLDPYEWAFTTDTPQRKLFAIPGNHDWYDGLSSFSALFCSARDRISNGQGRQIGGWRCHQERSYFAIKLPHNWWIWGPDIQLADNLDDSQRDYFDLMAEQTGPDDKIILCLAEPSWLHKNYDNMHEISMLARQNGARICAVIAGDWHHYSRYTSEILGTQFITSGGGGAFTHATHPLKPRLNLKWATATDEPARTADPADPIEFNRAEKEAIRPGGQDYTMTQETITATDAPEPPQAPDSGGTGIRARIKAMTKESISSTDYVCHVPHIYPSPMTSRLLCLKNLWLPFHNRRFAVLVGVIYFIYAWVYFAADPQKSPIVEKVRAPTAIEATAARQAADLAEARVKRLTARMQELAREPGVQTTPALLRAAEDLSEAEAASRVAGELAAAIEARKDNLEGAAFKKATETFSEIDRYGGPPETKLWLTLKALAAGVVTEIANPKAILRAGEQSPGLAFLLIALWVCLVYYVDLATGWLGMIGKLVIGTIHFSAHLLALLLVSAVASGIGLSFGGIANVLWPDSLTSDVVRIAFTFFTTLIVGGVLGGLVMGLYWTVTSFVFNMHCGDAFGALGIRHYKNFLRIKLLPDRAIIYAIALDTVPGRTGWRWQLAPGEVRPTHNPQILPVKPLEPRLIEPPIKIVAADVKR
jgi:hypothetical protein